MITCTALAIGLHIGTYHFDRSKDYNEFNPGIYAVCDGWTAGAYYNSERKASIYAGRTFERVLGPIDITLGAVAGYRRAPLVPMAVPSYKIDGGPRMSLLLPLEKGGGGLHLSWEF